MLPSAVAHTPAKQSTTQPVTTLLKGVSEQERREIISTKSYIYKLNLETRYLSLILLLMLMWKDNQGKNC